MLIFAAVWMLIFASVRDVDFCCSLDVDFCFSSDVDFCCSLDVPDAPLSTKCRCLPLAFGHSQRLSSAWTARIEGLFMQK